MDRVSHTLDFSILPYEEGVELSVIKPNPEFLIEIGEAGMRELIDRFYLELTQSPIEAYFPKESSAMRDAEETAVDFFIEICGGRRYSDHTHGSVEAKKSQVPFPINTETRVHWLECFAKALQPLVTEKQSSVERVRSFWNYLNTFSIWMIHAKV